MSEVHFPSYETFFSELRSAGLAVTPAELHGLMVGMISGGGDIHDTSWQPMLFDYTNDGMGWPHAALTLAELTRTISIKELTSTSLDMSLLLADDDNGDLFELADSVSEWVNHFISGLGLVNAKLNKASSECKEALSDLNEISKLGVDENDDMREQAILLEQVIEHTKACVLTIHAEFGARVDTQASTPTIH
ncbi:YecA family protein [Vibrio sp.]|nr:YecA family protein [Vibrio sp.]